MKFEPKLRQTEEGLEIRLNYQAPDSGKAFSFYIFAANGITDANSLYKWIKESHLGKENRPAILCHLGCYRIGVQLGDKELYGSLEEQEKLLTQFIEELQMLSGEYGSWWGETQRLLETELYHYGAFKLSLYYFTDDASKAPLEWDKNNFENWLNNHQKVFNPHKKPFEFNLIHSLPSPESQSPFFNYPSRVKTTDLNAFMSKIGQVKGGEDKSTVYLYIRRQEKLEEPKTLSKDWKYKKQKKDWVWYCTVPKGKDDVICVFPNAKNGDIEEKDISMK